MTGRVYSSVCLSVVFFWYSSSPFSLWGSQRRVSRVPVGELAAFNLINLALSRYLHCSRPVATLSSFPQQLCNIIRRCCPDMIGWASQLLLSRHSKLLFYQLMYGDEDKRAPTETRPAFGLVKWYRLEARDWSFLLDAVIEFIYKKKSISSFLLSSRPFS